MRRSAPARVQRVAGFALLIVLWTLVLVTLIVSQLGAAGQGEVRVAANLRAAQVAQDDADGAVYQAVLHVADPSPQRWIADGRAYSIGRSLVVRIVDEAGKIDPNAAPLELLQSLLQTVGADAQTATAVAQNIVDWRYPNPDPNKLLATYRAAGRDYAPPQAPFESLDEVGLVLGMTPALLDLLRPHLTVWHPANPDPAIADPIVLEALNRQNGGSAVGRSATDAPLRVLTITTMATETNGAQFTRRAVVSLEQDGTFRVLDWFR